MTSLRDIMGLIVAAVQEMLLPYGAEGLFILSFFNSSISVIPTEVLLVPLVLLEPDKWVFYGGVATVASVSGAVFAYYFGYYGGRPVLQALSVGQHKRVEEFVDRHGMIIVGISGISPLPFKLFCICSGVFKMKLRELVAVSLVFRGFRFFFVAYITELYGESAVRWIDENLTLGLTLLSVGVALFYVAWVYRYQMWIALRERFSTV